MRNVELDTSASGKWEVTDGLLTLSDPEGGSGSSSFPMLCQLVKEAEALKLAKAQTGSCPLAGMEIARR